MPRITSSSLRKRNSVRMLGDFGLVAREHRAGGLIESYDGGGGWMLAFLWFRMGWIGVISPSRYSVPFSEIDGLHSPSKFPGGMNPVLVDNFGFRSYLKISIIFEVRWLYVIF